ncbi:MAG TPA: hypothetical protein VGO15_05125 [Candidatus Limnocylindrales bacterium]|nr:hypothetical protein [Candidatus Limnocylindrales bacterium]
MSHRGVARRKALVLGWLAVAALLSSACGTSTVSNSPSSAVQTPPSTSAAPSGSGAGPSANPSAAAGAIYDAIEQQVIEIRGLKLAHPVQRQFIDATELRTLLTQQFDQDTPAAYLAGSERLYKGLGLIPETASLRTLSLDLLSGGVAAFYRNDENKLYVVSKTGTAGPTERFYFSHEFDHALQDQNSTIFKDQDKVLDQGDRLLARQAIYEGDATLLMTQWAAAHLTQEELLAVLAAGNDPAAQAVVARTPAILRDTLTFPYTSGFAYVSGVQAKGGWPAVDAYFSRMPESTEQILHPEKYTASESPVQVTIPPDLASRLGGGWTVPLRDTFGELQLGIWLREAGVATATATAAAAGWGGDRLAVLAGPKGTWAIAIHTEWDTTADATEFESAATTAIRKAGGVAAVLPGGGGKARWVVIADHADTLRTVEGALGLAG